MTTSRRAYGDVGEQQALQFLTEQGYHLLEHNWFSGHYEVDIIAMHFGTLVFVEVKTRKSSHRAAVEAVNHKKQGFLLQAARNYCQIHDLFNPVRFDIITVVGEAPPFQIEHTCDAFSADSYQRVEQTWHR